MYLDLTPVKSFLHGPSEGQAEASLPALPQQDDLAETLTVDPDPGLTPDEPYTGSPESLEEQQVQAPPPTSRCPATSPCPMFMECDFSWYRGHWRVRSLRNPWSLP